jgi:hypothetical protein
MSTKSKYRSRPWILVAVVAVLVALYAVYWFVLLGRFKAEIEGLKTGMAGAPFDLSAADASYSGFPYRLEVTFTQARVVRQTPDYQLRLEAPSLTIVRLPWSPGKSLAFADKPTARFLLRNSELGASTLEMRATNLEASLRTNAGGTVERLSLVFKDAVMPGNALIGAQVSADQFEIHGREVKALPSAASAATENAFLEVVLNGENMRFPQSPAGGTLRATVAMTGDPATPYGQAFMAPWRQKGGTLELLRFDLSGPKLRLLADASTALDAQGKPLIAGKVMTNRPEAVRALLAGQPLPEETTLDVPIELRVRAQTGQLYVGDQLTRALPVLLLPER